MLKSRRLRPRGRSGLKSYHKFRQSWRMSLRPRGRSGLKFVVRVAGFAQVDVSVLAGGVG